MLYRYSLPSRKVFEHDRLVHRKSPRIKRLSAAFTYGSLRALLWFRPGISAKRNRLKWETGNARNASVYSTVGRASRYIGFRRLRNYALSARSLGLLCKWRASMLTKSQYRWPTWMTMDADHKLVSQPSVDSENNERVTSERVGSSCFWCL